MTVELTRNQSIGLKVESFSLRCYYLMSTAVYAIQMITRVTSIFFSACFAIPFYKSEPVKAWVRGHILDYKVNLKLLKYAIVAIIKPVAMTEKINLVSAQSVNDLGNFSFDMIMKITPIEEAGIRLQFFVNLIKEIFSLCSASFRYVTSFAMSLLYFKKSEQFNSIAFHEFFLLSGHASNSFGAAEGIFFPQKANFSLVAPSKRRY